MEFALIDRSNYLKGLLILAKKDNKLKEYEKSVIREVGKKLGFSKDFYEETLRGLLENRYITDEPLIFSDKKTAESFIADGIKLILEEIKSTDEEINWLRLVAIKNGLSEEWFEVNLQNHWELFERS